MTAVIAAILFGLFLAFANGANDNFKGVATLFGSGTTDYRRALGFATLTTALGSIVALLFAGTLLKTFSGKGLVPDFVLGNQAFPIAVAISSGLTVWLATRLGFPISTTHAITGALIGAGVMAAPSQLDLALLGKSLFLPLLLSPLIALAGTLVLYPALRSLRIRSGVRRDTCVCVGTAVIARFPQGLTPGAALAAAAIRVPRVEVATEARCREEYSGTFVGVNARFALDLAHYASAGAVCFSRAVNDTPKIAAILLAGQTLSPGIGIVATAVFMVMGGLLSARRVAETMSHRVTYMSAGQGFTGNLVTSLVVIFASHFGVPVSTTHVSCGALFGIGAGSGQANWKVIAAIVAAWVITLPVAFVLGGAGFVAFRGFGL